MSLNAPDIGSLANLGALAVIAAFAVREFFAYLNKKTNGHGDTVGVRIDLGPISSKLDRLLEASQSTAGAKSSDWWELTFSRIVKQVLDDHESRVQRVTNEDAQMMREEMIERLKGLERQLALAVAEISRQLRDSR